ncbi:glutamate racemase [Pedobacter changchengzhani]|uniref:Glutamate racemase n=1 Tax=Pedobacter changchengzhani TaxID=2529274 RepID=A0A4R5MHV4_9SPHI|nr:glutamate racemase [Pedobacter changchengzhani]TDG35118.1 glutamate racemase [Pedobacter changchengzhani]
MKSKSPIGIFDSGYGGLTVFRAIADKLPQYNYIYLGDNARSPYGDHSFDTIYSYTLECVEWLFALGCELVILACNTASAKALRSIQQLDLPKKYPNKRVLGVIRPTAEVIGNYTKAQHIGVMGTRGTINSKSYLIEINKFSPAVVVHQQSCPMWVPLIENNEHLMPGADFFVKEYVNALLKQSNDIDCILLACTHYPLLLPKLKAILPDHISILTQGEIVANSLVNYLNRHPEMDSQLGKMGQKQFFTSGDPAAFNAQASVFFGEELKSLKMH